MLNSPLSLPQKSNILSYTSSGEKSVYIFCNEKRYNKGREVEVKTFFIKELKETMHKAENKIIETIGYAEIDISNNTKLKSAGERILLALSTKSLFAADVGYSKSCHDVFRSPKCNKKKKYGRKYLWPIFCRWTTKLSK